MKKTMITICYIVAISSIFLSILMIGESLKVFFSDSEKYNFPFKSLLHEQAIPVISPDKDNLINLPYNVSNIKIYKNFYEREDAEDLQENSLIFYNNIYMQNTGVLYESTELFDVLSVADGTITNIKEDNILGNVIEVTHTNNLISIYHCLETVDVITGDFIKTGDLVGISGKCQLGTVENYYLLLEIYHNGKLVNPESYYNKNLKEL